ncbi:TldD/PmbA family protein, partial [Cupriavidus sp. SIMBA_020]
FNGGKVRQTGSVSQGKLTLRLIDGARQAYSTLTVCGDPQQDLDEISAALAALREGLRGAADDPHLLFDRSAWQRSTQRSGKLPDPDGLLRTVA